MKVLVTNKCTGRALVHDSVEKILESEIRFELIDYQKRNSPITSTSYHKSRFSFTIIGSATKEVEIDPDYFTAQEERYSAHTAQLSIFAGGGAALKTIFRRLAAMARRKRRDKWKSA